EEQVVVRRGDCLWDLAARRLGPMATAAEIAAESHRWYQANRGVIGPDPDLLRPGQLLRPPPASGVPSGAAEPGAPVTGKGGRS
ncbi:MAG TPA: LysM domain-containing protein, partial [Kineosporiaceae bacterium]|nr:LysM domain-containing protein [Kineosporiaceae bacterium]